MSFSAPDHSELESFANFVGLDYAEFYEAYYGLDNEEFEQQLQQEEEDLIEAYYSM
mgnify:CR=1 FL=1